MKKKIQLLGILFALFFIWNSCAKKYDVPPLKTLETVNKINVAQIKLKFNNTNYKFKSDSSLYCVVIADEVSGNLYKDIYVRDVTGALHVKLIASGGLFIGDSIRINLQGCTLNDYNDLIQLDSVDSEKNIVKLASGFNPQPVTMTIKQLVLNTSATNANQSKLIKLENVEFVAADVNAPYADAIGKTSVDRILKSCDGSTVTVRTSGYSSFANKNTPSGNGSFMGIASQYRTSMQLIIRNLNDLNMTGASCTNQTTTPTPTTTGKIFHSKDFQDNSLSSGGWNSYTITSSSVTWTVNSYQGSYYAKISGKVGSSSVNSETWFISPAIDISTSTNPIVNFETAAASFAGAPLDVLVSTNYNSGLPSTGTWTSIASSCAISPTTTSYVWTKSGDASLNNFKSNNFRFAFKYQSSTSASATYEIDNIYVKEK